MIKSVTKSLQNLFWWNGILDKEGFKITLFKNILQTIHMVSHEEVYTLDFVQNLHTQ